MNHIECGCSGCRFNRAALRVVTTVFLVLWFVAVISALVRIIPKAFQ